MLRANNKPRSEKSIGKSDRLRINYIQTIYINRRVEKEPIVSLTKPKDENNQYITFNYRVDRSKDTNAGLYVMINNNYINRVSISMFPIKQIIGEVKYIEILIPKITNNYFSSQIECARKYPHLSPNMVKEVSYITHELNKLGKSETYFMEKIASVKLAQAELSAKLDNILISSEKTEECIENSTQADETGSYYDASMVEQETV